MALTQLQNQFYKENGYLAVENLIPPNRVNAMRRRIEALCENWESEEAKRVGVGQEADQGNEGAAINSQTVRKFSGLTQHEEIFRAHAQFPPLVDIVIDLIGNRISLYADQALLKPPEWGSEKPFHQDNAYFQVDPDDHVITCWCALDQATPENGCMHYIPGSHTLGIVEHEKIEHTPHLIPKGAEREMAVAVPVSPGTCIFHHSLTLHMSPPNRTDTWRRAMVCHYVRDSARTPRRKPGDLPMIKVR